MRADTLEILRCPYCGGRLELVTSMFHRSTPDEIQDFCSASYGTTFPMGAKALVNGRKADPLWVQLTAATDAEGKAGEVLWNFEKFLVDRTGQVVARFRPLTDPAGPEVRAAIEKALAS